MTNPKARYSSLEPKFLLGCSDYNNNRLWVSLFPEGWNFLLKSRFLTCRHCCRDLNQPFNLRWFQILYLIISTYFVGQTLGGLASLRNELDEVRIKTAWGRREVSRGLIDEMQPEDNNGSIDQYEFLVASLLQLQKISSADVAVSLHVAVGKYASSQRQLTHIILLILPSNPPSQLWIR